MNSKKAKHIRKELDKSMERIPNTAGFKDKFGNIISKSVYKRHLYQQFKAHV